MFDRFAEAGGTLSTPPTATSSASPRRCSGDFLAADRDHFVVATKFTNGVAPRRHLAHRQQPQEHDPLGRGQPAAARHRLHRPLLGRTSRTALTPIEEILRGLDDLVRAGQDPARGPVELPRLAGRARRDARRPARLGADRRHPARVQPGRAHRRPRAAADGRGASASARRCGRRSAAAC